jgi:hypothetical protein
MLGLIFIMLIIYYTDCQAWDVCAIIQKHWIEVRIKFSAIGIAAKIVGNF